VAGISVRRHPRRGESFRLSATTPTNAGAPENPDNKPHALGTPPTRARIPVDAATTLVSDTAVAAAVAIINATSGATDKVTEALPVAGGGGPPHQHPRTPRDHGVTGRDSVFRLTGTPQNASGKK